MSTCVVNTVVAIAFVILFVTAFVILFVTVFVILFVILFVIVFVIAITSSVCDAALTFLVSHICTPTLGVCHRLGQRFPGSDGLCRGAGS